MTRVLLFLALTGVTIAAQGQQPVFRGVGDNGVLLERLDLA